MYYYKPGQAPKMASNSSAVSSESAAGPSGTDRQIIRLRGLEKEQILKFNQTRLYSETKGQCGLKFCHSISGENLCHSLRSREYGQRPRRMRNCIARVTGFLPQQKVCAVQSMIPRIPSRVIRDCQTRLYCGQFR
jgi:hypothetical protein